MAMDEFIKAFRDFIGRDLVFLLGGGAVVGSLLHLCDRLPRADDSWVLFAILGAVAYFVAYALQELLSLVHAVTTTYVSKPGWFVRWLYYRYHRKKWIEIRIDVEEAHERMQDPRQLVWLERIAAFRQVGTAGGPCMVTSGLLFCARAYFRTSLFDLGVGLAGAVLGIVLISLGWLKAAQEAQYIATHGRR